jgi:uncharacterized membrane protein
MANFHPDRDCNGTIRERSSMRKLLELLSAAILATLLWITYAALYGSNRLTSRIPTHFGPDGQPNAWGEPKMLLLLPLLAIGIYTLMTVVSRFPNAFNYPVRVTPLNRNRLQKIALTMIASLKAETLLLFLSIQYFSIQTAHLQSNSLPPSLMPAGLVVVFATIAIHIAAMRRAA